MKDLNKNQKLAAEYSGKHLLVLAGAGTGKTKTIIARATHLIKNGVDPEKIQILTFTKKAASEIVSRVESSIDAAKRKKLSGSTFHAWCNHLLHKYPKVFGLENFTILDSDDQVALMKLSCGRQKLQFESVKLKPSKLVDIFSFMRNTNTSLSHSINKIVFKGSENEEDKKIKAKIKKEIEVILRDYQQKKMQRRYLDYDDMLMIVGKQLQSSADARRIIGGSVKHLLVDEMQDTNPLQWELLKPFIETSHLFCVGDDAQSIYAFRGADFKNIHNFKDNVKDSKVFKLEDNYRSTQEILDLSNWLLEKSPLKYDKKLKGVRGKGIKPIIMHTENEWKEADFVAETIENNFSKKNKKYSDHLILARGQVSMRAIQAVLLERKIPFQVFGGRKFMESAHIKDALSALRAYNNLADELAWIRFLTFWNGIGEVKAAKLIDAIQKKDNISDVIQYFSAFTGESEKKITEALISIQKNNTDLGKAIKEVKEVMLDRFISTYEDWSDKRAADFPILEVLASKFSTVQEFIAELLLDDAANDNIMLNKSLLDKAQMKDVVTISTVHSAKGLEADTCFILNVSPGSFPSVLSIGKEDDVEEERRVLYVALTRAKNHLYICRGKHSIFGEIEGETSPHKKEAYFLNNLPVGLVENIGENQKENKKSNKQIDLDDIERKISESWINWT